jgi:hypothetical protein
MQVGIAEKGEGDKPTDEDLNIESLRPRFATQRIGEEEEKWKPLPLESLAPNPRWLDEKMARVPATSSSSSESAASSESDEDDGWGKEWMKLLANVRIEQDYLLTTTEVKNGLDAKNV